MSTTDMCERVNTVDLHSKVCLQVSEEYYEIQERSGLVSVNFSAGFETSVFHFFRLSS